MRETTAHGTWTTEMLASARGQDVRAADGEKIGTVDEIFVDRATGRPEWLGIGTGFLRMSRAIVPLAGARVDGEAIVVPYDKDTVKDAPDASGDEISEEDERHLYEHYGLAATRPGRTPAADAPTTRERAEHEATLTRSEEELHVGKRTVPAGTVRLRKWVETEPVERELTLRRETAHVTREPVGETIGERELGEEEIEVELEREQPATRKEVVAKERVGIAKGEATERETVRDEVRKERVELDGR